MKRTLAVLGSAMALAAPGWAADLPEVTKAPAPAEVIAKRWNLTVASEVRFFSWSGDRGSPTNQPAHGSGSQVYVPFAAQISGKPHDDVKVDIIGRGGWVWARQKTGGLQGDISTATDTTANATVTYFGIPGFQPFVAVSANLPTGNSFLSPEEANARMDPDLVEISSFGEGVNIGPTIGFNLPITQEIMFTASAGYTWRNSFLRDKSLAAVAGSMPAVTDVDPGDNFTVTASVGAQYELYSAIITGTWTRETITHENHRALYRAGDRYLLSATFNYNWEAFGVTTLAASAAHSRKNDVLLLNASTLQREFMNTNSNLYKVSLQHLFPVGQLWIGPMGSYLYRDENGYNPTTLQFVPAKERWTAGLLARYAASEQCTINARIEHVWTDENDKPSLGPNMYSVLANGLVPSSAVPNVSSTAWQGSLGFNVVF